MKVLLAGEGLFTNTGGGQRFYEGQVLRNPDTEFFAFSEGMRGSRDPSSTIPRNLRFVPLLDANRQSVVGGTLSRLLMNGKPALAGKEHEVAYLMDVAASVAGINFDVVDIPDYMPFAALLPSALRAFDVKVERFALSMHGTLSMGLKDNWDDNSLDLEALPQFEDLLHRAVDIRYGISSRYVSEWASATGYGALVVDPGVPIALPTEKERKVASQRPLDAPELCFVGRQEKWKGPDIFVEFCSRLPKDLFSAFRMIGPDVTIDGKGSYDAVTRLAETRGLEVAREQISPRRMREWYTGGSRVVMLPSRRDTFNLVALESLLSGCPAIISTECGVIDYLDEHLPGIPFVRFDPEDIMGSYDEVVGLATDFDQHQRALEKYLSDYVDVQPKFGELVRAYEADCHFDVDARASLEEIWIGIEESFTGWLQDASRGYSERVAERFHAVLPDYESPRLTDEFAVRQHASASMFGALCSEARATQYREIEGAYERAKGQLGAMSFEFNRVNLYRFMAEFERRRGNDLLYATYMARVFRLTGQASSGELEDVLTILREADLVEEAEVLSLVAGGNQDAIHAYLQRRRDCDFTPPKTEFACVSDRRVLEDVPRVSVVVSVYNAAELIPTFLRELLRQTPSVLADSEYVFVDSNSTDDSFGVLDRLLHDAAARGMRSLLVSTPGRETIQRAWNRGIGLARGSYLTFLGVDETVRPDALGVLADFLDDNPDVDWAQGNVVVTEVNEQGSFVRDVMPYIRTFDMQEMHYLDSCYIGFVGAMYRHSVHDRFGLYDDTFRGAGDTEFKNRVLPRITVAWIPEMLGTYLNYPSERTTASPRVELEDIRAWYVYRTPAGVRYLFESRNAEDLARLLVHCLAYRKTYLDFTSTDVDLASAIIHYADEWLGESNNTIESWRSTVWFMAQACRRADDLQSMRVSRGLEDARKLTGTLEEVWYGLARAREGMQGHGAHSFEIVNDNRWQQHHWLWPSQPVSWSIGSRSFLYSVEGRSLADVLTMARIGLGGARAQIAVELGPSPVTTALNQWDTLDLFLLVSQMSELDERVLTFLTEESNLTVVIVEFDAPAGSVTSMVLPSVLRVPTADLRHPELLLQAARVIAIPSVRGDGSQVLEFVLAAVCTGTPLIMEEGVATFLNQSLALAPQDGFEGIASTDEFLTDLIAKVVSGEIRERESMVSYSKARALIDSDRLRVADRVQSRVDEHPWTEYCVADDGFDDAYYVALYPDVREALDAGRFGSAWEHFQRFGRAEGRRFKVKAVGDRSHA